MRGKAGGHDRTSEERDRGGEGKAYSQKMSRYKQRKDRQHSEWDADGQTIIIEYWEKQRGGCRGCYFHFHREWI